MLQRIREQIGGAGLIVGVIAAILAISGAAYAAGGGLSAKQKKEVKVIAKANTKAGAPGPVGPVGSSGATGKEGLLGKQGETGPKGDPGKSVTLTPLSAGQQVECEETGGARIEEEGSGIPTPICNGNEGAQGPPGPEGVCSTSSCVLPPGVTETGTWAFSAGSVNGANIFAPISFAVPLGAQLTEEHVHFQTEASFATTCTGLVLAPSAPSGELCVYYNESVESIHNATFTAINKLNESPGANRPGAYLQFGFSGLAGEPASGFGSWAVTGM